MSNLEKAKEIVKANYSDARYGIFDSRNTFGDSTNTIYSDGGLTIVICYDYEYFEVFGLSESDFEELERYYNSLAEGEE